MSREMIKPMKKIFKIKKLIASCLLVIFCCLFFLPCNLSYAYSGDFWDSYEIPATRQKERLLDAADLLTDNEEKALLEKLNSVSQQHESNIVVLTVYDHSGSIQDFADDYFDYNGFQADYYGSGILFMLSMEDREWAISTSGTAIEAFTDYGQEYMTDEMLSYLSSGEYYLAFERYVDIADYLYGLYEAGTPYDVNSDRNPNELKHVAIASILVGLGIGLVIVGIMAAQLSSVHMNANAGGYQSHSGIHMTVHRDTFIRTKTSKRPIPRDDGSRSGGGGGSSVHTSSSGSSHGGSSGHF